MTTTQYVESTIAFVRKHLEKAEAGHDWFHTQRVFRNTLLIARDEKVDVLVVSLAALLHDIADAKFYEGNEKIGPKIAGEFLKTLPLPNKTRTHVLRIVRNISFRGSLSPKSRRFTSAELQVVQDADRLDALGAIGIARAFHYGGFTNALLYDPDIPPRLNLSKKEYMKGGGTTINHFYEKLLLLTDSMQTESGRKLAEERHQFLLEYLKQFFKEWNGTP